MKFAKFQKNAITKEEQVKVTGGDVWDLINAAWNATPSGGVGHWENTGDACFSGWTYGGGNGFQNSDLGCF
ncbi:MAG: hypothetical protein AAF985_01025 [Bacteroidota bacterium]